MKRTKDITIDPTKAGVTVEEAATAMRRAAKIAGISLASPDLILTADWHLREDQPECRTDYFWDAQWNKVREVARLQKQFDCPVWHAGDLFHHWKPSPWLLSFAIQYLPKQFMTVYGQHDLPQHNLELFYKSGINVLNRANVLGVFQKGSWGQPIAEMVIRSKAKIGVWHKFAWDGKKLPWPGCEGATAKEILKANPSCDLIVTGDHHKPFTVKYKERRLVNPGCLTRQAANYTNHKPRVWLWYADDNSVVEHFLTAPTGVVSRDHIEQKEAIDKRMDAFITRLSDEWEIGISFEENLERFLSSNKVRSDVKELIYKAIDNTQL